MSKNNVAAQLLGLTMENITENVKLANSQTPDPRLKLLMEKLVDHLHDYIRETRLTNEEWKATLQFLTECGKISTPDRPEFLLLGGILGALTLVGGLNNPKPPNATESSILGPFYRDDVHDVINGESIVSPGKGEICLVLATVKDTKGKPIEQAKIVVWETDGDGHYDNLHEEGHILDMRGRLTTDKNGDFYFKCVKPTSYPIPTDGPVGKLLEKLHRHPYRPAHIHFRINVPGDIYDELITALYIRGDPYESSDSVFGAKTSLIVDLEKVEDALIAKKYGVDEQDWLIKYDFVLTTRDETRALLKTPTQG